MACVDTRWVVFRLSSRSLDFASKLFSVSIYSPNQSQWPVNDGQSVGATLDDTLRSSFELRSKHEPNQCTRTVPSNVRSRTRVPSSTHCENAEQCARSSDQMYVSTFLCSIIADVRLDDCTLYPTIHELATSLPMQAAPMYPQWSVKHSIDREKKSEGVRILYSWVVFKIEWTKSLHRIYLFICFRYSSSLSSLSQSDKTTIDRIDDRRRCGSRQGFSFYFPSFFPPFSLLLFL